ncbi:hypothetical protein [uncultured Deefgea sp.]|uniref:hypothetical protein n=1 Tax=uncultured Deefgea sp. TaxID=1304914 RepID=UPI002592FC73|nr:hypothetical protein [uncultured Deefgea sp.]
MMAAFFASRLAPYLITLFVFTGGAAVGGAAAWDWASSRSDKEIATIKADHQQAVIAGLSEAEIARDGAILRGNALSIELAHVRNNLAESRVQLSRNVPNVTTIYRPAPKAAARPLPACIFTAGFVRDWNTALGVPTEPKANQSASGTTDPASQSNATDGLDASDINQADILTNHIDNANRCQIIESQLNQLIDWHTGDTP